MAVVILSEVYSLLIWTKETKIAMTNRFKLFNTYILIEYINRHKMLEF